MNFKKLLILLITILPLSLTSCGDSGIEDIIVAETLTVGVGTSVRLEVTLLPTDTERDDDEYLSYYSDDNATLTISDSGVMTGVALGSVEVTVSAGSVSKEIEVDVVAEDEAVTGIDVPSNVVVIKNRTAAVRSYVLPRTSLNQEISYSSLNETIAKVDSSTGNVTGVEVGMTQVISTTVDGNFTGYTTIEVVDASTTPITDLVVPTYIGVKQGTSTQLSVEVVPSTVENPAITYASLDNATATVSASGVVTGVAVGSTTVSVSANNGTISRNVIVEVYTIP